MRRLFGCLDRAFFFEIALSSILIASISASSLHCVSCPCGSSNQNYTQCIEKSSRKDFTCERWLHCQTCRANTTFCVTCPPDRLGSSCLKISGERIRKKRQDVPNLLNYPMLSGPCPFLERPDSGSIRCTQTGNDRTCTARCLPGYHFEGEENVNEMTLRCRGGIWTPQQFFPQCKSGGQCEVQVTGAGFYNCTIDMDGTHCDITCDGWQQGRFHCYPGRQWQPPLPFCTAPKEQAPCSCQNGGVCGENGRCTCPAGRSGAYCENLERQRASCPDPGIPRDGKRLNPDGSDATYTRIFKEGESVIFTCNGESFALQGSSFITCLEDGTWSANRPRCVRSSVITRPPPSERSCRHPGVDINGRIDAHPLLDPQRRGQMFPPDTELSFRCNEGYTLEGETILVCQRSGEWSSAPPTCIQTTTERSTPEEICRHPGVDVNGRIEGEPLDPRERRRMFPADTALTFSCNDGFQLEGSTVIYCLSSGEWTSFPPSCRSILIPTDNPPSELTQLCPVPRVNTNVEVEEFFLLDPRKVQGFEPGQELTFKCKEGYDLEGSDVLRCLFSGRWSNPSPTCISRARNPIDECPTPEVDPNGEVEEFLLDPRKLTQSFERGTDLTFRCKEGYVLEGWSTITCGSNGRWSSPSPRCHIRKNTNPNVPSQTRCLNPGPILNGRMFVFRPPGEISQPPANEDDFDFPFGTHLKYKCNDGFILVGGESMSCESNSYWSGSVPMCTEGRN